jgi:hypothetical protein
LEVSAEELSVPFNVARQQQLAIWIRECTVHVDGGRPGDRGYLARHFTALLEAAHGAVENNEIWNAGGSSVAFEVDVFEAAILLQRLNQIFIKRDLKLRGQLDLVRLDYQNGNRGRFNLFRLPSLLMMDFLRS